MLYAREWHKISPRERPGDTLSPEPVPSRLWIQRIPPREGPAPPQAYLSSGDAGERGEPAGSGKGSLGQEALRGLQRPPRGGQRRRNVPGAQRGMQHL